MSSQHQRDNISKTLDEIHTAASQNTALTTFSEYTSPTSENSSPLAADHETAQNGVSGLLERFKEALGGFRERPDEGVSSARTINDPTMLQNSIQSQSPRASDPKSPEVGGSPSEPTRDGIINSEDGLIMDISAVEVTDAVGRKQHNRRTIKRSPSQIREGNVLGKLGSSASSLVPKPADQSNITRLTSPTSGLIKASSARSRLENQHRAEGTEGTNHTFSRNQLSTARDPQVQMADDQKAAKPDPAAFALRLEEPASGTGGAIRDIRSKSSHQQDEPREIRERNLLDVPNPVPTRTARQLPAAGERTSLESGQPNAPRSKSPVEMPPLPVLKLSRPSTPTKNVSKSGIPSTGTSQSSTFKSTRSLGSSVVPAHQGARPPPRNGAGQLTISYGRQTRQPIVLLSKEFWMADGSAKDCFLCGDVFNTFRRKHHCRICGQIFDAKCTAMHGSIKVCKACLQTITDHDAHSDCQSESEEPPEQTGSPAISALQIPDRSRPLSSPMMAIPARRHVTKHSSRNSAVLEIDADYSDESPKRPPSARSVRQSLSGLRPPPSLSHRRFPSRQLAQRMRTPIHERAPFHRSNQEDVENSKLSAFHSDSIVDPDLNAYLSDEGTSGDEQMNLFATISGHLTSSFAEASDRQSSDRPHLGTRRPRSRFGLPAPSAPPNVDDDSRSIRSVHFNRYHRKPHFGSSGNLHRLSTQMTRHDSLGPEWNSPADARPVDDSDEQDTPASNNARHSRMTRSSSMTGDFAPPIELNSASLTHCRKLLEQLLTDDDVANPSRWQRYLLPILLRCTDDVNPDIRAGDDLDIRHYVKIKRIPGGRPGDSSYVSGIVFTKNMALKSMPRSLSHPKIMIIAFPLEYSRHNQRLMSLEPVLRQEREYLRNIVNRIVALRPDLLLVQSSVSGRALQLLEAANIATVFNLKESVVEAVARCTQADVVTSMESLNLKRVHLGRCASAELKTFLHPRVRGGKKTYFFITGCARDLGCTVILRGASMEVLAKIKRLTEFMIYVVNNLKLETCLMQDEKISSESADLGSGAKSVTAARRSSAQAQSEEPQLQPIVADCDSSALAPQQSSPGNSLRASDDLKNFPRPPEQAVDGSETDSLRKPDDIPDDTPMPTFYTDVAEKYQTKILSASPFVKFMQPYLLMRAREQERRLAHLRRLRDQDLSGTVKAEEKTKPQKFQLIIPEMLRDENPNAPQKVAEVLHAIHDAEHDKALHNYETQARGWETYITGNTNLFDPMAHQSIAVLYSLVCTATAMPCSGPEILTLGFYNQHADTEAQDADCSIGQYVEDLCRGSMSRCPSCTRRMSEHHRCYVHGEAKLDIHIEQIAPRIPDMKDTVLMWSFCKLCNKEMPVRAMSESTWKYSFGKYLELSFWSKKLRIESGECPHDCHRDHIRYMSLGDIALRIHYDPVGLLEIVVPRSRITWKVENDLRMKVDAFKAKEGILNRFMLSVKSRIRSLNTESVVPEKIDDCRHQIEKLQQKANKDHEVLLAKLQKKYMKSRYWEIVPLNRATRALQEKVNEWDMAFAQFDKDFFPSERDIRRLAALQMKKLFLERDETLSLSAGQLGTSQSGTDYTGEPLAQILEPPTTAGLRSEHTQDLLHSVMPSDDVHGSEPSSNVREYGGQQDLLANSPTDTLRDPERSLSERDERQEDEASKGSSFAVQEIHQPEAGAVESAEQTRSPEEELTHAQADGPSTRSDSSIVLARDSRSLPTDSAIPRPSISNASVRPPPSYINVMRARTQPDLTGQPEDVGSGVADGAPAIKPGAEKQNESDVDSVFGVESFLTDKFAVQMQTLRQLSANYGKSRLPRAIPVSRRTESARVSTLAKHFEQMSREFEKERLRERRQRAESIQRARRYPLVAARPIVEVYKDAHAAVAEKAPVESRIPPGSPDTASQSTAESLKEKVEPFPQANDTPETPSVPTSTPVMSSTVDAEKTATSASQVASEDELSSDEDADIEDDVVVPENIDQPLDNSLPDFRLDLPRQTKSNIMKLLTNFWAERSASGWTALEYPLAASDHLFADSDMIVREDEPSSLIAWALSSEDYITKMASSAIKVNTSEKATGLGQGADGQSQSPVEESQRVEDVLLQAVGTHLKYQVQDGTAKMECKIFYAEQFEALRQKCGCSERIVESLSRCGKWDAKGGKTRAVFLKTLDDRFIIKSLSAVETQAFLRFAPAYFQFMSQMLFHELPSVIAKMLGFYQIVIRNPATGVDIRWDCLVMENLFYDRYDNLSRIFDLKGSMRNRKVKEKGEGGEVLLDENMVEYIYEKPLFAREHSKKLLRASVWNDTLFLARQNVMDYSLMVAIDDERHELIVGIVDCIRTYTWDKKLESWIKEKTFMPGGKGGGRQPTVMGPKEYKSRFREAMKRYVLEAPNCWHQFGGLVGKGWVEDAKEKSSDVKVSYSVMQNLTEEAVIKMQ